MPRHMQITLGVSVYGGDDWDLDRLRDWVINSNLTPDPDILTDIGAGVKVAVIIEEVQLRGEG